MGHRKTKKNFTTEKKINANKTLLKLMKTLLKPQINIDTELGLRNLIQNTAR